jgi:AAA ATPase domain
MPAPTGDRTLIGRERESDQLYASMTLAAQGQAQVVLVAGDAGIGKTSLVVDLSRRASELGFTVTIGHCLEIEAGIPLAPVVEATRSLPDQVTVLRRWSWLSEPVRPRRPISGFCPRPSKRRPLPSGRRTRPGCTGVRRSRRRVWPWRSSSPERSTSRCAGGGPLRQRARPCAAPASGDGYRSPRAAHPRRTRSARAPRHRGDQPRYRRGSLHHREDRQRPCEQPAGQARRTQPRRRRRPGETPVRVTVKHRRRAPTILHEAPFQLMCGYR